jgi:endogenous inhibitor of DNA gyrase (YacG/DUF329 family)
MRNHCPYAVFNGCDLDDIMPEECVVCPLPHQEPAEEADLRDEYDYVPACGTCGTPLAYEGPRARDAYCSDRCYGLALAAANEAASNRYI